jgi:hypothetical protein
MRKIKLITIVCLFTTVSCASIPKKIRNAKSICYSGTNTNIESLINIKGYFFDPSNSHPHLMFYNNGLVVSSIHDYNRERRKKNEPDNIPLFLEEVAGNPNARDALF